MDLGGLEVGIDRRVDDDDVAVAAKLVEEGAEVREHRSVGLAGRRVWQVGRGPRVGQVVGFAFLPSLATRSYSGFVTGWIERRRAFRVTIMFSRPGVGFSCRARRCPGSATTNFDVDGVPRRRVRRALGIVVVVALLERERVRIARARNLGQAGDAGRIGVRRVEQHAVADLHWSRMKLRAW